MIALRYWRLIAEAAVVLALLLALWACDRERDKLRDQLSKANALIEVQNSAVDALKAESNARTKAAQRELVEAKRGSARAEVVARQLEKDRPLSGACRTPPEVLRAGL